MASLPYPRYRQRGCGKIPYPRIHAIGSVVVAEFHTYAPTL
ncbi:hypothetical protein [Leyella stercorea]